uniref:Uncharacterized protein n=1 Tax=Kalanchoe fedtschenkoi TaxID=63787 RepID=A0A7N0VL67_KALFE
MPGIVCTEDGFTGTNMDFSTLEGLKSATRLKTSSCFGTEQVCTDSWVPVLPGLPDDVSKHCLVLVPRGNFPTMGGVCKKWTSFVGSKEFITIRKLAGLQEEWLYVLTKDAEGHEARWDVLDRSGNVRLTLPPMPGPKKTGFGIAVLNGKLLIVGGVSVVDCNRTVSADVYQYDSCLNRWSKLASMNTPRHDFACAAVNGVVYVVGGYGADAEGLSSAEAYNTDSDTWTPIESLRRPRWGCFACGLEGKLYVMGGRSTFSIGNSKYVSLYDPETQSWRELRKGCVMVTAHTVLGNKLYCIEWKNQRKLAVFDPLDESWSSVPVPLTGSSDVRFQFGTLNGKLLLFSLKGELCHQTLMYDPDGLAGKEWQTSEINPSGMCLSSVTIEA